MKMQKTKRLFERISLDEVREIMRNSKNRERDCTQRSETLDDDLPLPSQNSAITKRTPKLQTAATASTSRAGDDYPLGLWMDKDMFHRHQRRQLRIVLHHRQASTNNRYLTLADLALSKPRQKTSHTGKNDVKNEARAT